ncbi:MAG: Ferrichrome-iron receptor [Ramlibacter sp.]|nr:Ferrichrome-iron receptor [Ramlibacter sp.]
MRLFPLLAAVALPVTGHSQTSLAPVLVTAPRAPAGMSVLGTAVSPDEAPAAVTVIDRQALQVPGTHSLAGALARDPAIGESYATTGYYENFNLRGFLLDLGSSYRINGFVVPGELHIALDNKEAIEVLKGVSTLAGGMVGAGGAVNFLAKRPADVRSVRIEWGSRGGSYVGVDLGAAVSDTRPVGIRVNLAHEEMRPAAPRAQGHRDLASLALDARIGGWDLMGDAEHGRRAQPAVPGFQLLGGTVLPDAADVSANINQQPWSRPVRNEATLLALRANRSFNATSRIELGVSDTRARIDDSLAFPFGCNGAPYQYFCADGGYVLYDYRAFELRRTQHWKAIWSGEAEISTVRHAFTLGAERIARKVEQNQLYSTTIYDDAGRGLSGNLYAPWVPLPAPDPAPADLPTRTTTKSAVFVADRVTLGDWRLHLGLRMVRIEQRPAATVQRPQHALPQAALVWLPRAGERWWLGAARGVEFGSEAPLVAQNAGEMLPARRTTQIELGWTRQWSVQQSLSVVLFQMRRPYEFTDPIGSSWAGLGSYRQAGWQRHVGAEAEGKSLVGRHLQLSGNIALLRARAIGTGVADYENVQMQNVPRVRSNVFASYAIPGARDVAVDFRWLHVGARNARRDALASAPGYDRIDAGVTWAFQASGARRTKLMLGVQNLTNRRYWRDVGEAYSADLLFPGAPRSMTLGLLVEAW